MIMELHGLSAWISVDSTELTQYNIDVSPEGNKATCWIPSETGKKFTLNWRDSDRACQLAGYVYVDGVPCGGNTVPPGLRGSPVTVKKSSIPASTMSEKPFIFSRLELTDDDSLLDRDGVTSRLGEISIEIWRVALVSTMPAHGIYFPEAQKVHEKSKKALAHRVELGDEVFAPQTQFYNVKKIDYAPLATFTFKYRSLDMLQANGIAPVIGARKRSAPSPVADEDDEIRALENRLNTLKSRRSTSNGNPSKRIKREPPNSSPLVPGEVIDLT